ncbi:PocR ligand-binding domain-containing protein [Desulfosarcina ovata]|uniref:histidine kinase n=1 Tax=Desulfosarcina ovata subsp. ovata TaxID=2752305 RepID=A0A5K8AH36_9BACT|nr:PAS domain S-box protein [Desulfosarcina ovata]BBO91796.1 hypothetical protein DSCOOX_49760 [Desulfosarcina ovata subsp. ovata]
MDNFRLTDLIDLAAVQKMADAHYQAAGMPLGIVDAKDDSIIVSVGWQDICADFHRANPKSLKRCQASDNYIKEQLSSGHACQYKCKNGLMDVAIPIFVSGRHMATMFLGQFFYQGEAPDRTFFIRQAQDFGYDLDKYLAALDRVPVFSREKVDYILEYNKALVGFITTLAENALLKIKADEAVLKQQYFLQSVIDCADRAIFAKDETGRYILSNQYHANLLNSTPVEVIGKRDIDFKVFAPFAQAYTANDSYVWRTGRALEFEEVVPQKDGQRIYLSCKYPLHNPEGNIFAVCGIATDITQRKRIEEELEQRVKERTASLAESESKFRGLVENTMDIPFSIGVDGRVRYIGPQTKRYDFDPNAIKGCHILDFIVPDDHDSVKTAVQWSIEKGETSPVEFRIQVPDGRIVWFEGRSTLQRDTSGNVIGFTGVLRDVTERKRIEKVLKESEERYRNLFEAEAGAILVFDAQTQRFMDVNPAAERLYGYTREEFLNLTYWDISCEPQASKEVIKQILAGLLREPVPIRWHRKKDGSVFPVEISPSKFTLEGKAVLGGIMRDITTRLEEQKQRDKHQKRLRQLAAKLAAAQDEEQQRIAQGLHDDVAQDLALCNLKLALADREKDSAKANAIRNQIGELIHKTAGKIRSLSFELSSSSLYRIGFKEAIVELCSSMARRYDVCFKVKCNSNTQMMDNTTAAVLFKAVRELLFNVVKHAGTKDATVFIDCEDSMMKLAVEDRGRGFSQLVDDNLINMGKGMGLFGIKERLSDLGGNLHIESTPGNCTRVMLQVPVGGVSRT